MRAIYWILGLIIIAAIAYYAWGAYQTPPMNTPEEASPVAITPIEHATLVMDWGGIVAYVDPTDASKLAGQPAPSVILVTDIHGDHFSTSTLEAVAGSSTLIVPQAVYDELPSALASSSHVLANGESTTVQGLTITAVPMYNLPGSSNATFHTPGRGNGYIVEKDGYRVYVAGDTAGTPEMRALTDIDIAFVPMNLPYTMTVDDAADAVLAFKPKTVYPYHYRGQDGLADVERFKEMVAQDNADIRVVLADWYQD